MQPSEPDMPGVLGVGKINTFSEKTKSLPLRPDPFGLHLQHGKLANIVPQKVFGAAFRRACRTPWAAAAAPAKRPNRRVKRKSPNRPRTLHSEANTRPAHGMRPIQKKETSGKMPEVSRISVSVSCTDAGQVRPWDWHPTRWPRPGCPGTRGRGCRWGSE